MRDASQGHEQKSEVGHQAFMRTQSLDLLLLLYYLMRRCLSPKEQLSVLVRERRS